MWTSMNSWTLASGSYNIRRGGSQDSNLELLWPRGVARAGVSAPKYCRVAKWV